MKYRSVAFTAFVVAQVSSPSAFGGVCDVGPTTKTYGHLEWLVYSCRDDPTLVFAPATDTPTAPFFFMLKPLNGNYQVISSETINDQHVARNALTEIEALSNQDIAKLIEETRTQ
jgi:hypothetical protein